MSNNYCKRHDIYDCPFAHAWYTVTVHGVPVDGSTDDYDEAQTMLFRANSKDAYDGEARITVTQEVLAW